MTAMSPIDWAKRPLQKYADFSGRAPRAEYWWFTLFAVIALAVLSIIENILGIGGMVMGVYGPLTCLLYLALLVPSLAVGVRRLHDTDRTGWWLLPCFVFYGLAMALGGRDMVEGNATAAFGMAGILMLIGVGFAIVLLVFYCLEGTKGDNKYGPDPYAGQG